MSSGHHPRNITPTAVANDSTSSTPSREYQTRLKRIHALLEDPTSASSDIIAAEGEEGGLRASRRLLAKSSPFSSARTMIGGLRGPGMSGHVYGSGGGGLNGSAATRRGINDSGTPALTHVPNKRRKTVDEIVSEMERLNVVKKELARKGLLGGKERGLFSVVDESSSRSGNKRSGNGVAMKAIAKPTSASTTNGVANGSASGTLRQISTVPVPAQDPPPRPSPSTSDDAVHVPPSLNPSTSTTRRASTRLVASATASSLGRDTAQQSSTRARANLRTRPAVAQSISYPSRLRSSRNSQTRREQQRQLPSIVKKKSTESSSRAQKKRSSTTTTAASSAAISTSPTTASVRISEGKPIIPGRKATEPFKRATVADRLPVESEEETTPVAMADPPNHQHPTRQDITDVPQDLNPVPRMSAPTTDQHTVPSILRPIPLAAEPGPRSLVPTGYVDNCVAQSFIIDSNPDPTTSTTLSIPELTNQTAPTALLIDDFDLPLNPPELPPTQINTRLLPANQTYPEDAQIPHNFFNPPIYHDFVVQRTRPALPAIHSPMTSEGEDEKRYWKRKAKRAKGVNRTFYKSLRRGRGGGGGGGGGGVGLMAGVPVGSESISASGSGSGAMFLSAPSTSGSGSSSSCGPDFNAWADELLKVLKPRIIDIVDEAVENAFMKRSRGGGGPWGGGLGATSLPFEEEEEEEGSEDKYPMDQERAQNQPEDIQEYNENDRVGAQPSVILDTQLLERDRPRSPDVAHQASLEPELLGEVGGNDMTHPHTVSSPGQLRTSVSPPPHKSIPQATPPPPQDPGSRIPLLGSSPANARTKTQPPSRIAAAPVPAPIPGIPSASEPTRIKVDPDMVEAMQREHERLLANLRPLLTRDPTPMSEDEDEFEEPLKCLGSAGHEDLDVDADADADADAEGESDNGDVYVGATVAVEDVNGNAHPDGASNMPVGMDLDHQPGLEASELAMDVTLDDNNNSTSTSTLNGQPNAPPFMQN